LNNNISFKEINRLAIPALFAGIAEPLLSMADTAFVGHLPVFAKESLAAVGLVGVFLSMLIWVLAQTRSAISTIISQYYGAKSLKKVEDLPAQVIFSVVLLAIIIVLFTFPFAESIFRFYNADDKLLDLSISYFHIRIFGLPFTLYTFAIFGVFTGLQNTFYPMLIAITGVIVNIILDYFLIFGIDDYLPALHVKGAAYASIGAQVLMALMATYFLIKKTSIRLYLKFPINHEIGNLTHMVFNLFIRTIALNIALYLGSAYATKYGNDSIAAYTIAVNIWFLFAFVIDAYSSAGNILSGKLFGSKSYVVLKQLGKNLLVYGLIVGIVLAVLSFIIYIPFGRLFIENQAVLDKFYSIFWIVLLMQPINGIAFIFDGIFKGLGYMKYLRNILLLATFIGFIPTLLLADYFGLELYGIWIAFTIWMLFRASTLYFKFKKLSIFQLDKKAVN
jgi:putative MATE family efflux protein